MKKCLLLPFLAVVFTPLFAQVMGNYGVQQQTYQNVQPNVQFRAIPKSATFLNNNEVEISINALSNQKAESYTAIFSMLQVGKTADETNTLLNTRLDGFLADLKNLGIPAADIYVDMVNFLPKYEYDVSKKLFSKKTYTEIPKGFELQKNIHIRYTTPALLDRIVTAAARQEIYDIVKVDYFVSDPQSVHATARCRFSVPRTYKNAVPHGRHQTGFGLHGNCRKRLGGLSHQPVRNLPGFQYATAR